MKTLASALLTLLLATSLFSSALSAGKYPNALPDLRIAKGSKDISEAWFSHPTKRYQHFVLGSNYEAGAINVRTKSGKLITYKLDQNSVFEDRIPRLSDLDGDGKDEIIVVRAYLNGGAALSVFGVRSGKIKLLAETPDMGHPFGWLNPAGIADFDGDGQKEIAFVRKPHVLGRLEFWRYKQGSIKRIASINGVSTHSIGSKFLGLSTVADFDGDGTLDLAVPSMNKRELRFLKLKGGIKEISRKKLPGQAASDFRLVVGKGVAAVDVGLKAGKRIIVSP